MKNKEKIKIKRIPTYSNPFNDEEVINLKDTNHSFIVVIDKINEIIDYINHEK